ncbi:MAG: tetratricopeptide repeat protein [Spirochaetales bacterium]|nr:tetratricopeptide repeat protein [Spirochaetales bacterium]
MPALIALIIIIGLGLIVFIVIMIRRILGPRRIEQLVELLNQNKTGYVIRYAKRLIGREPRNTAAHYILGKAYCAEENYDMALVEFRTVNNIGIFDHQYCQEIPFRKEVAELYKQFEQTEEALKEYLLLAQLEPFNPEHYYECGLLFEERNNNEAAAQYFQKAIDVDKSHSNAHYKLGYLNYRQKKTIEAKIELELALRHNPENRYAHFFLAKLLQDAHDLSNAIAHFEQAQKSPELKMKATVERGHTAIMMGKYEKAIPELQRALTYSADEGDNDTLYGRYYLAEAYEKIRDIERAVENWEKIYAKKPNFLDVSGKLSQYQELRIDDRVKDYLTSKNDVFMSMCREVVAAMNLEIRETTELANGCQIIAVEAESKWRNARKLPRLIRFYRISDVIKDATVRSIHEEMKKLNVNRGIVFTTSGYSKPAMDFAETRPIDLFDKDKLQEYLNQTTK